jgi:hypothetical protein
MEHSTESITNIVIAEGNILLVSDDTKNLDTEVNEQVNTTNGAEADDGAEADNWEEDGSDSVEEKDEEDVDKEIDGVDWCSHCGRGGYGARRKKCPACDGSNTVIPFTGDRKAPKNSLFNDGLPWKYRDEWDPPFKRKICKNCSRAFNFQYGEGTLLHWTKPARCGLYVYCSKNCVPLSLDEASN